jgi:hypothetical protein
MSHDRRDSIIRHPSVTIEATGELTNGTLLAVDGYIEVPASLSGRTI